MFSIRLRIGKSWPARRWSLLAPALAILGILLPATGCLAPLQMQNLCFAGGSSDEGESEFPDEDEGGDSADGEFEAHLPKRCSPRESLRPALFAGMSIPLAVSDFPAGLARAHRNSRHAPCEWATPLPLRC